jgi:hypothetical protein
MDAILYRGRSGKVVVEKETTEIDVQHTVIFVPNFMSSGGKSRGETNVRGGDPRHYLWSRGSIVLAVAKS